jgi:microcystin degradation protein MlrC
MHPFSGNRVRIGIISLLHESNTFIGKRTTLQHFRQDTLLTGNAIRERFVETQHEIGGFFAGLAQEHFEAVPIFAARAVPYGPIETETFLRLLDLMQFEVEAAGDLDGVLVAPHGATVCESIRDADGFWLNQLRQQLGTSIPMIGTADAHANLSASMVDATNALISYRTNPHLDQRERGIEAAQLMARTLRGEIVPVQHAEFPPLAINIERQMTTEPPLADFYQLADVARQDPGILSNSLLLGFPYADVEEMGSAVLVVADSDRALAADQAKRLAKYLWQNRELYAGNLTSMDAAFAQAKSWSGPVCLLDMGDNVGGGSPGDSTHMAHAIRKHQINKALICICDPNSVQQAVTAGTGAQIDLQVGGRTDDLHGAPYSATFVVQGIYDGKFTETQTRHGGLKQCNQGRSVVIQSIDDCGLTILLTTLRMPPFSLVQLTSCGIDPTRFHILVAKGVNAPVAAYAPICKHLIRVNSPGCTTADMKLLNYQHRRQRMFPFEQI